MNFGLQCFDADGNLLFSTEYNYYPYLIYGTFDTGFNGGTKEDAKIVAGKCIIFPIQLLGHQQKTVPVRDLFNQRIVKQPQFSITDGKISWTTSDDNVRIAYGGVEM